MERILGDFAATLGLGFGFLQDFLHPIRQNVHDRTAETVVIRRLKTAQDVSAPSEPAEDA